jgi:hypothetical protein
MANSILAIISDASIDFVDLIRFILRLERRTMLMDQLGLFIAGKSNVYTMRCWNIRVPRSMGFQSLIPITINPQKNCISR